MIFYNQSIGDVWRWLSDVYAPLIAPFVCHFDVIQKGHLVLTVRAVPSEPQRPSRFVSR